MTIVLSLLIVVPVFIVSLMAVFLIVKRRDLKMRLIYAILLVVIVILGASGLMVVNGFGGPSIYFVVLSVVFTLLPAYWASRRQ